MLSAKRGLLLEGMSKRSLPVENLPSRGKHTGKQICPCHSAPPQPQSRRQMSAFSLAETIVSVALVGGLLVVALDTVGASRVAHGKMSERSLGQLLAQDLMAEILRQEYEEPVDTPAFGREGSESGGSRADYDDVDDYHNWDSSPPEYKNGTEIPGRTDWRRNVTVEYVDSNDPSTVVGGDLGVKRITVTVKHKNVVVSSMLAIRTDVPTN